MTVHGFHRYVTIQAVTLSNAMLQISSFKESKVVHLLIPNQSLALWGKVSPCFLYILKPHDINIPASHPRSWSLIGTTSVSPPKTLPNPQEAL